MTSQPKERFVWLNIQTGEFSNSWDVNSNMEGSTQEIIERHKADPDKYKHWKLIKYSCPSDLEFEFTKRMRIKAARQFNTPEEILAALTPGTIYYRVYWGSVGSPRKVVRIEEESLGLPSDPQTKIVHTVEGITNRAGELAELDDFLNDMQNCEGKGVFTNKAMAIAYYIPRKPDERFDDFI